MIRLSTGKFGSWPKGPASRLARPSFFMPGFMGGGAGNSSSVVAHSLRARALNSAQLSRTTGTAASDRTKATVSVWVKRGALGGRSTLYSINSAGSAGASNQITMSFENAGGSGDNLTYNNGSVNRTSTRLFRDTSAFMHFHQVFDTSQATAADRVKTSINNELMTDINIGQDFSLSSNTPFGQATVTEYWFRRDSGNYGDFLVAHVIVIVGQALPASDFGRVSGVTGQWVPKTFTGTYGSKDYCLKFDDASAATAAAIGADSSGNGNNWTPSGVSVTAGATFDQSADTPTANYARLDPNNRSDSSAVIANANTTYTSGSNRYAALTQRLTSGKWYCEGNASAAPSSGQFIFGVSFRASAVGATADPGFSSDTHAIYVPSTASNRGYWTNSAQVTNVGSALDETKTYRVAIDIDAGKCWLGYDTSSWIGGGDPASGTSPTFTFTAGTAAWIVVQCASGNTFSINTGFRTFTHGAPSGFSAIYTGSLPVPAVPKATDGFVSVIDTEANIETTLAAARSGWTNYVEILKNRAASESWAWRFSHDASYEHAADTTDTYQTRATRTMSGSNNWVGYALRIGALYGTAAGSASHTNGAATTITHNLGTSRNMVILFPRAGGDIYYYHPDLTAGSLLKLNTSGGQVVSSVITSVGSNSFQIGSGVATGTYDYLVISEVAGFCKLFSYTGNSSSDGPKVDLGLTGGLVLIKDRTAASGQRVFDLARDPTNGAKRTLTFNNGASESPENFIETYAVGMKLITGAGNGVNDSSSTMVGFALAKSPFKYANAA